MIKFRGGAGQGSGPTQPWLERLRKFMQFQRVFWVEGDDMDRSLGRITIHDAQLQTANCARKIRVIPTLSLKLSSSPEPTAFRWLTRKARDFFSFEKAKNKAMIYNYLTPGAPKNIF